jgi:hypothetical protein
MRITFRLAGITALALLVAACSGDLELNPTVTPSTLVVPSPPPSGAMATPSSTPGRSGTPLTLLDVTPFVKGYVRTSWNYLSGTGTARALYDLFMPDCQRMVSLTSLERTPVQVQNLYKGLMGKSVDDVEFAIPPAIRVSTAGVLEVRLPLSSQTRFRIDGNSLTEFEWTRQLNPAVAVDKANTLLIAPIGDSFRITSCEQLRQWDRH